MLLLVVVMVVNYDICDYRLTESIPNDSSSSSSSGGGGGGRASI